MKATGIIRNVDELGRIVIPKELRRKLEIEHGDAVEIFVDEDLIILRKYTPACIFCGDEAAEVQIYKGKKVCKACLAEMAAL
ncbi:MAG: AbrB/MazE/SpoVT family DNA-binding domain-containing protein [Clostridia bacterium]|nr:AbrB/MazE/SpoVT family DNA-binding domain-containing protein [Clostridia bacterium]